VVNDDWKAYVGNLSVNFHAKVSRGGCGRRSSPVSLSSSA
jgi:hypothetical protein